MGSRRNAVGSQLLDGGFQAFDLFAIAGEIPLQ
jgi:hypothetical protein